jgi:hypothetical protein
VVEPLIVSSTYASQNDGSYLNVMVGGPACPGPKVVTASCESRVRAMDTQLENKHSSLELLVHDVGLHLNHSVKSLDQEPPMAPPPVAAPKDKDKDKPAVAPLPAVPVKEKPFLQPKPVSRRPVPR